MTTRSRLIATVACVAALIAPAGSRAAGLDYEWALPEWRATWAAPRLADNRGFAVRATDDAVYVAGVTGSHGIGAGDLFLLRYDLAGARIWERWWGGFELDQALAMAVDASGIWLAGSATDDDGTIEAALLRFTTDGVLGFSKTWSSGIADIAQAIALTPDSVYVAGLRQPTRATRDLFVTRFDRAGAEEWTRTLDGGGWDEAWDVASDGGDLFVSGYTSAATTSQALLMQLDPADGSTLLSKTWGDAGNDEARALAIDGDAIYVTGGAQAGRNTDVFVARHDRATLAQMWHRTTGGKVVGGGGYGISLGARGIYVAGGSYDFPAGGDAALLRFSRDGALEWTQVMGLPGFWDWAFDVDVRDGRFYTAGVLWQPGAEWYRVMTLAYQEDFPTATLTRAARWASEGDDARAADALQHFWPGDFLRWAQSPQASTDSRVEWEGTSDQGREYGHIWADSDEGAGQDRAVEAVTGLSKDLQSGNYAFVRDYTTVKASIAGGFIRFRYTVSHDRLIPQGGYIYIGELGIPLPPPPV